jgi:hypothetical protein
MALKQINEDIENIIICLRYYESDKYKQNVNNEYNKQDKQQDKQLYYSILLKNLKHIRDNEICKN